MSMDLTSPAVIKSLLDRHGFRFSKSFGQNFLIDRNIVDRIIEHASIAPTDFVVEIGPGFGVLTVELCRRAAAVLAIEIDKRIPAVLQETVPASNLDILLQDILRVPLAEEIDRRLEVLSELQERSGDEESESDEGESRIVGSDPRRKVKVVANLPYYITTPILMLLLEEIDRVDEIVVMMQKEVADRIMAQPGTKDYGVLTLSVQYYAEVSQVCRVSRGSFMPSPNVDSTVLHLKRRRAERFEEEKLLFSVIRAAFGQRRKTLQNALSTGLHLDKQTVTNGIMNVGLSPQVRGETLRLQDFIAISREIRRNDAKAEL